MTRAHAAPMVLVDAWNVMRSRWPNLDETAFVESARAWGQREGAVLTLVFDGRAPGGLLGESALDERTSLVGTEGESADDWIAREARRFAADEGRVWLVSTDRALRKRVAPYVERIIGGGAFATMLETLE